MGNTAENRRVLLNPEERLRLIEENVRDYAMLTLDTEGKITSWNAGAENFLGYTEEEVLGKPGDIIFTPEDRERGVPEQEMSTARVLGRALDERWHACRAGGLCWGIGIMTALRESDGELRGYAKILRDFTDRKLAEEERNKAEARLMRTEAQFRMLVDNVRDHAIFLVDAEGRVSTWNEGAERITRFRPEEAIGLPISALIAEDVLYESRERGHIYLETTQSRKDGSTYPAAVAVDVVFDSEGALLGYPVVIQDLTERRKAEDALHRQMVKCEDAARQVQLLNERLQRSMIETHHRVKNNLQVMSAMVDMQIARDEQPVLEDLHHLSSQIRALAAVHGVLTEEAKENSESELVSASAILERLLENLRKTVPYRRIKAAISELRLPMKQGTTLALLVNELVSNAIKHGQGEIDLKLTTPDGAAILEVCDDGPGFPPNFQKHDSSGTGLELIDVMVRWDLNGTLEFGSWAGGAKVTVAFPLPNPVSKP